LEEAEVIVEDQDVVVLGIDGHSKSRIFSSLTSEVSSNRNLLKSCRIESNNSTVQGTVIEITIGTVYNVASRIWESHQLSRVHRSIVNVLVSSCRELESIRRVASSSQHLISKEGDTNCNICSSGRNNSSEKFLGKSFQIIGSRRERAEELRSSS